MFSQIVAVVTVVRLESGYHNGKIVYFYNYQCYSRSIDFFVLALHILHSFSCCK